MKNIEKYIDHSYEYFNSKKYISEIFRKLKRDEYYNSYLPPGLYEQINRGISECIVKRMSNDECVDFIKRTVFDKR